MAVFQGLSTQYVLCVGCILITKSSSQDIQSKVFTFDTEMTFVPSCDVLLLFASGNPAHNMHSKGRRMENDKSFPSTRSPTMNKISFIVIVKLRSRVNPGLWQYRQLAMLLLVFLQNTFFFFHLHENMKFLLSRIIQICIFIGIFLLHLNSNESWKFLY